MTRLSFVGFRLRRFTGFVAAGLILAHTQAVETVPASATDALPAAILRLLEPARNAAARAGAAALYRERFDPTQTLKPFFAALGATR